MAYGSVSAGGIFSFFTLISYHQLSNAKKSILILAIAYHGMQRGVSSRTYAFNSLITTTPSTTVSRAPFTGIAFGTFKAGSFSLNWTDTQNYTDFMISTKMSSSSNIWSAIGFSYDQQMVSFIDKFLL
jgi:hypothetical protein